MKHTQLQVLLNGERARLQKLRRAVREWHALVERDRDAFTTDLPHERRSPAAPPPKKRNAATGDDR